MGTGRRPRDTAVASTVAAARLERHDNVPYIGSRSSSCSSRRRDRPSCLDAGACLPSGASVTGAGLPEVSAAGVDDPIRR